MPSPLFPGVLVAITVAMTAGTASAADEFDAKSFVEQRCVECHDSSVYTRPNRRVDSLKRLEAQVRFCDAQLGVGLFDEDVDAIVKHLNDTYYKFDQ